MKAAVLYGKEDVRVEEIEPKALGQGEVRVRIEAASPAAPISKSSSGVITRE